MARTAYIVVPPQQWLLLPRPVWLVPRNLPPDTPGREPAESVHVVPLFTSNDVYEEVRRPGQTLAVPGSEVGVARGAAPDPLHAWLTVKVTCAQRHQHRHQAYVWRKISRCVGIRRMIRRMCVCA